MKKILCLILSLVMIHQANAQEQPDKKQLGDKAFDRYEYFKALGFYLQVAQRNRPGLKVIERIADCYRLINDYENAEAWYAQVVTYPKANNINTYYYAEALLRNKKFNEAKTQYSAYYAKTNDQERLQRKLATCDSAVKWIKTPENILVKNEGKINTYYSEWALVESGEDGFIFASDRSNADEIYNRTGNGFYNLYKVDKAQNITDVQIATANTSLSNISHHTGPIAINKTGDTAYVTITTLIAKDQLPTDTKSKHNTQHLYTRRLQLMVATKQNGEWGNLKSFAYNDVKRYSIGQATLSKDGNVIYFISDMPGGQGGTDIWYSLKQNDGYWGKPINCGGGINSSEDEAFPTINADGALYFSSKGLPGMGGHDVYRAIGEKNTWATPSNLKYPINSTSDDFYYITQNGVTGYISSDREGGKGYDDIYSFENKGSLNTQPLATIPDKPKQQTPTLKMPLKTGATFVLKNIYYDLDKADIRPDAAAELDKLIILLKEHPKVRIEIASHTDSRAPAVYNLDLSNRRAASAMAYLMKNGIALDRLSYRGYGDTRLLNDCVKGETCSEAEHQLNRRTEVKIISGE